MKIAIEGQRIDSFIYSEYNSSTIQQIVNGWRLEPAKVCTILTKHFESMGVFLVTQNQVKQLQQSIIHHLHYSSDISNLRMKVQREDKLRSNNRHSD